MKRLFDILVSAAGLLVFAPVAAVIAVAIRLEDGGPALFRQARVGRQGRVFTALKFRSMVPDAERVTGPVQASLGDPRITRVGRLLRPTALDELPQLWNILRGDMSVVGPRPLRPGEADTTDDGRVVALHTIPGYVERHAIRPGLTGLSQVFAPRNLPRTSKFRYDLVYRRRQSLALDLYLIALSFWITIRGRWEVDHRPVVRGSRRT
jgi:lipopolysaccharide/colanic/teichoic acid biosynthesis glycosyltransferase